MTPHMVVIQFVHFYVVVDFSLILSIKFFYLFVKIKIKIQIVQLMIWAREGESISYFRNTNSPL